MQFLDTPYQFTLGTTGQWVNVDLSSVLPPGAVGIIGFAKTTTSGPARAGWRKPGVSSNLYGTVVLNTRRQLIAGLTDRVVQAFYADNSATFYVTAYYEKGDAVFLTGSLPSQTNFSETWAVWDVSQYIPEHPALTAAIVFGANPITGTGWGVRPYGSTLSVSGGPRHCQAVVTKLGPQRKLEIYTGSTSGDSATVYLIGYLYSCGWFDVDGTQRATTPDSYQDVDTSSYSPKPRGAVLRARWTGTGSSSVGARPNGSSRDDRYDTFGWVDLIAPINTADYIYELYRSGYTEVFETGYFYDVDVYVVSDEFTVLSEQESYINPTYHIQDALDVTVSQEPTVAGPRYVADELAVCCTLEPAVGSSVVRQIEVLSQLILSRSIEIVYSALMSVQMLIRNRLAVPLTRSVALQNKLSQIVFRQIECRLKLTTATVEVSVAVRNVLERQQGPEAQL